MKKTLIILITLFIVSTTAYSQIKIGVINAQEIIQKTKKGQHIQRELESLQKNKQLEIERIEENLKKLQKDLSSPALSSDRREELSKEMVTKKENYNRLVQDAQKEVQMESQKALMSLQSEIMPEISDYGRNNGFTIIFDMTSSGIAYFDQTIDITNDIVNLIDAR